MIERIGRSDLPRGTFGIGFLLPLVIALAGCSGAISRVELDPAMPTVCDANNQVCGVPEDVELTYRVWGKGKCDSVGVAFGDERTQYCTSWDFGAQGTNPCIVKHTYHQVWPGAKTVHAYSVSNCTGEARLNQNVLLHSGSEYVGHFWLGIRQPTADSCSIVPGINEALRKGAHVFVETSHDPVARINFGCAFGGCIYDADGEPNSVATNAYPVPGMRKYSLVLEVGAQQVQGGTHMDFVVNHTGLLKVCINDDNPGDNSGYWGIKFTIDESQAEDF